MVANERLLQELKYLERDVRTLREAVERGDEIPVTYTDLRNLRNELAAVEEAAGLV